MKTVTTRARLRRDERGQGLAEYAIAIGVITLAVIVAVQLVGARIVPLWNSAAANIQSAADVTAALSIVPCRSQPTRASQVRAAATGGGPTPAAGGSRHPVNHAADEHGSIPVTCFKCFRKLVTT